MEATVNILATEPALVVGVIDAAIILAVTFGVPISADQKTAIDGVLAAVLAILGATVTRSLVTPVAALPAKTP